MSLTYSDFHSYPESTAAEIRAKLARLRLFKAELEALSDTGPDMSADGFSESWGTHEQRLSRLSEEEKRLEQKLAARSVNRLGFARIGRRG